VTGTGVTVSINNGVGTVTTSSKAVSPTQTTTYTLNATNTSGSATAQVTVTVNPKSGGSTPPTVPVITSSSAKSSTEIDLSWSASTDAAGVTGYQILRNGSAIGTVSGTTLTYANTALSPSTTYTYTVKAFDAAGNYSAASNSVSVTTPAAPVLPSCSGPATNAFTGCYYANTALSGTPVLVRTDNQINFAWGAGSPSAAVPAEDFSVRWQGNFTFSQGTYKFNVIASDGMRLYVDGNMILNYWRNQPPYAYTVQQTLTQGTHLITVEYYEATGGATAYVSWQLTGGGATGSVPAISSFTANPASITAGQTSTLSWNVSGATTITIDNSIGSVTGTTSRIVTPAQTTTYTLTAANSAGSSTTKATVTVSAKQGTQPPTTPALVSVIAKTSSEVDLTWTASTDTIGVAGYQILRNGALLNSHSGATLTYADISVAGGTTYTYTIKAFDAAGNVSAASNGVPVTTPAALSQASCATPGNGVFTGCYYTNTTLSGTPVLVRTDNTINFDWRAGSPASSIASENFSVQWQGNFNFAQGSYKFYAITSDGMKIYIDGVLVLNRWYDQPPYEYTIPLTLSQGNHLIVVDYYERTGGSEAMVWWVKQ
jgi:chitodextrinase